jgi:Fe-S-cluster containining protein
MKPSDLVKNDELHPCQRCGACCAAYRVSFYWAEADDAPGGVVPVQLTQTLSPHLRCMQGTSANQPRCVALDGVVGQSVGCQIYLQRPSPCHELSLGDPQCLQARARYGLPPP